MYIYKFMNNLYIMETEKYYGLNEPDKTTTIDSSNIDYNIPGQTTENPLINISPIKNYKKLVDCPKEFTLTKHNDEITDSSLQVIEQKLLINNEVTYSYSISTGTNIILGTPKDVYLGYEDINKIFDRKLSSVMTAYSATLDSDVTGCSAKLSREDTTGALIKYSLNKCTADRIITFSYKNTPIFKINQTYDNSGSSTTKTYIIYVCSISGTDFTYHNGFAFFDTNNPISFSIPEYGNQINEFIPYYRNQDIYVLAYTKEKMLMYNRNKIGTLLKNGQLTHLSDHDYLTQDKYKDLYLDYVTSVNHFELGTFSTTTITFDMDIHVYINKQNAYVISEGNTFNFDKLNKDNHLGVYKLTVTT